MTLVFAQHSVLVRYLSERRQIIRAVEDYQSQIRRLLSWNCSQTIAWLSNEAALRQHSGRAIYKSSISWHRQRRCYSVCSEVSRMGTEPLRHSAMKTGRGRCDCLTSASRAVPRDDVPAFTHELRQLDQLFQQGPVAFLHMRAVDGRPMVEPSIMIRDLIVNVVVAVLISLSLKQVASFLPTSYDKVKFVY